MKKLKQLNPSNSHGDCLRTCFACLLDFDSPEQVPDFAERGKNYEITLREWCKKEGYVYSQMPTHIHTRDKENQIPAMYPTGLGIGITNYGGAPHAVIIEVFAKVNGDATDYTFNLIWCPLRGDDCQDYEVLEIAFLSRAL